jgi:hypothetical protein
VAFRSTCCQALAGIAASEVVPNLKSLAVFHRRLVPIGFAEHFGDTAAMAVSDLDLKLDSSAYR